VTKGASQLNRGFKSPFAGAAYSIKDPHFRLWHERLGHLSEQGLVRLRSMVTGMDASQPAGLCICEGCVIGRQTERPHKGTLRQGQYPMDVVHTDIAGPFDASFNQSKYWITHLCGWSGYAEATPLQNKDEAFGVTRNFIDRHERPERRCRLIIQDRGGENLDENYITWAYDRAIELQYSDTDQHQACGKAERLNRTIKDKLQPSLVASGLDPRH
jgi:hypothetical protein